MRSDVDLALRPATPEDADVLAALLVAAREAAYPAMPRPVHPPDDVRRWLRTRFDAPGSELWLAEQRGVVVGLLLLEDDWVHSLYVAPGHTGSGIGTLLLDVAKSLRPHRLGLWVFESNLAARRFYARNGFVQLQRTDGSGNEEQQPDVEMTWPDPTPLQGLRVRIDQLDDRLAVLLSERAETTARIQQVKDVPGHAGRDPDREGEIAARMARLAPALGEQRLRRIMDVVISESLDAAEEHAAHPRRHGALMTRTPLPDDVRELLTKPNPAVITSVRPDGQPVSVATWYLLDPDRTGGDRILVNMDEGRKRLEYLRNDPRVSLTALDETSWYTHVSVQGRVVELAEDPDLAEIDRLAVHYTGKPYPTRDRGRVSAWIEVEAWHGWGGASRSRTST